MNYLNRNVSLVEDEIGGMIMSFIVEDDTGGF